MNAPPVVSTAAERLGFTVPPELEAGAPPPARDAVRLLVADRARGDLVATAFRQLPGFLRPGDLLVVNTSATVPAAVPVTDRDAVVHLATPLPDGSWLVELRRPAGHGTLPSGDGRAGDVLPVPGRGRVTLVAPWGAGDPPRLWVAQLTLPADVVAYLHRHGRPVRYGYARDAWPLSAYQTVYATEPGSAEMPSAGRPFTTELLARLVSHGVGVTPLVLHAGLSSPEAGEAPQPERFRVPAVTAHRVAATRAAGGRVIAVGTTVVRALETTADAAGRVRPAAGWTELVIAADRPVRTVDGLLTGWHEPRASHLALLEAVAGREVLVASYQAALAARFRWHEFGDLHLIL